MNRDGRAGVSLGVIGVLATALLGLAATTFDIHTTASNTYSPQGLRVAPGDTVRWDASTTHPLVFDEEGDTQYTSNQQRTLDVEGSVRFHCAVHGGQGMTGLVTVGSSNEPPAIAVQRETALPAAGQPVAFRAVASDPERLPLRIDWDLDGDGAFEGVDAGASASGAYEPGQYTVSARATDDLGATAISSHTFTVPAPAAGSGSPPPGAATTPSDTLAPLLSVRAPRSLSVRRLRRRGVPVTLTPSEDGSLVVELRTRHGRRLARATAPARAGHATVLRVRAKRARPGRLRLRIVALDRAGNRRTVTRRLTAKRA